MQITTDVSAERIADMMVGAIEGGCNYWCNGVFLRSGPTAEAGKNWYENPALYAGKFLIEVLEDAHETMSGATKPHFITHDELERGLKLMAEKYPRHFADIVSENDDATTADVFLQCVALGDIVYG